MFIAFLNVWRSGTVKCLVERLNEERAKNIIAIRMEVCIKEACRREWEWYQATMKDARCVFEVNGLRCMMCGGGGYAVGKYFDGAHKTHFFERLGNALNFMERFNPESEKSMTRGNVK